MQQRHQILLVEDNEADVVIIRKAIDAAGTNADLHIIHDGKAAMEFFDAIDADPAAPSPNLVLLDMNLPKKNGDDVLRHLRAGTRCRDATVLIVSSSDAPRDQSAVASLGIAGYFKKPSDYTEFMKLGPLVRRLLNTGQRA
ncbi:MAG: response regulator [Bryobacterales bacterium]|nr:response regulator [Bryobacterales bacterium]MBV9398079.1 response regulator [Bryobacterales bacterium]